MRDKKTQNTDKQFPGVPVPYGKDMTTPAQPSISTPADINYAGDPNEGGKGGD